MMSKTQTAGIFLLLLGLITLSVILLSDWLVGGTPQLGAAQLLAAGPAIVTTCVGALLIRRRQRALRAPGAMFVLVVGSATGLCAILVVFLALEPGRAFRHDRTTGPKKVIEMVVKQAGLSGIAVCLCAPDKKARIVLPGGFETQVAIYDRGGAQPRPGLVVAHGNTWMGGNLSTYRLLASRLAKKGHIVLTIDFMGFGQSDDPFGQGPSSVAAASDTVAQLHAAIDYLITNTHVDRSNRVSFSVN